MELSKQVTSLELSKHLRELGVKQESLYRWQKIDEFEWEPTALKKSWFDEHFPEKIIYSAFTASELLEMLPDKIKNEDDDKVYFFQDKYNKCHRVGYVDDSGECTSPFIEVKGETEANARAKMLIYLIENKIIEV